MPISTNKNVWISLTAILAVMCAVLVTLFYFQDLFLIFLVGLCLIAIVDKCGRFYNKYTTKLTHLQRLTGIVFILIILAVAAILFVSSQMAVFTNLFSDMSQIQGMIDEGTNFVFATLDVLPDSLSVMLENYFVNLTNSVFSSLTETISTMFSEALFYLFSAVLLYPIMFKLYFKEKENIQKRIESYVPKKFKKAYTNSTTAILTQANNFFVAKIIESICIAVITSVGFYLVGIPGWLFFGILSGLLNNVPYIGPTLAAIPPVLIGLTVGINVAFWAGIVSVVAQAVDNFYLIPFMISDKVNVNPLTTVIVVLVFAQLFGALGMILCIPIYIFAKIILTEAYNQLIQMFPSKPAKPQPRIEKQS
ncbi:putative transport protein YhhT [Methanosarcinaceae archaeon Ag5]|uniref:Transport protein YhhT n=1 Tax=Methanolapillus africanus TaxID=3028297 RepID=A0AAE4MJR2_9EURY|nr:putative transport protein YhhT [Methanosarcinaceae archaeon Ag5]